MWEPAALIWANPDAEYPGAVSFESICTTAQAPEYRALGDAEIGERLYEAWAIANNARKGKPVEYPERRASLSGMRGKIGLAWHNGRWHAARGAALSDWIAKHEDSARLRGEAGIESLCQKAMDLLGVPAARTLSRVFGDQQCVLSQRADRVNDPVTGSTAIHQEDFAQATAWPGGQKYDAGTKDEPRWEAAYALLRAHGASPEVETAKLTRMLVATWMLGHCDLHRRNLGFTHVSTDRARRIRLAPMYDVSSAIGTYLGRELAIGVARQKDLTGIGPRQWLAHARFCRLDPDHTLEIVRETVRNAPEAIAAARETVRGHDENRYQSSVDRRAEELVHYARKRQRVFEEQEARRLTRRMKKNEMPPGRSRDDLESRPRTGTEERTPTADEIERAEQYLLGQGERPALNTLVDRIAAERLDGSARARPSSFDRELDIYWRLKPHTRARPKEENQQKLDRENRSPVRSNNAARTAAKMLAEALDQYQRDRYGQSEDGTPRAPPSAEHFTALTARGRERKRRKHIEKTIKHWHSAIAPNLLLEIRRAIIPLEVESRRQLAHEREKDRRASEARRGESSAKRTPAPSRPRGRE